MTILRLALLCVCVNLSYQRSTVSDDSYVAAVLEYQAESNATVNLQNYVTFIQDASAQGADIVVFPELTLTTGVPFEIPINGLLLTNSVPALAPQLFDSILVELSQAALDYQVYVVVNVEEVMNCTNDTNGEYCPEPQIYYFNTNVVFDRNGAIIDRYRKINLFGERFRTPALSPELGLFTTDFGVTFGHFICFDLQFQVPAVQIVQKHNVSDVIFTTMWYSELPYLTAVQIQEAYAYEYDINFLASGANTVSVGSAGSGIFSGKAGALISTMPGVPTTRLLVTRVPKVPGNITDFPGPIYDPPSDADSLYLLIDPTLSAQTTRLLTEGFQVVSVSQNEVSCNFRVNLTHGSAESHYVYRVTAFDGVRTFSGMASGGNQICSVVACTGNDIESCGVRFPEYAENTTGIFHELSITASVPVPVYNVTLNADDAFFAGVSVGVSMLPLSPREFELVETIDGDKKIFSMSLLNNTAELYSFGVWGRVFDRDGEEATAASTDHYYETTDASSTVCLDLTLLAVLMIALLRPSFLLLR